MPFVMVTASMVGFGSLARDSGLTLDITLALSIGLWGLPGQVAMAELHAMGAPIIAIVLASSMGNLRFLPMGLVMMPVFRGDPQAHRWRFVIGQIMAINPWTVFMRRAPQISVPLRFPYYMALAGTCLAGGALGTVAGYILYGSLPFVVTVSLVFLNPAYFVFVFSSVRQRNCIIAVVLGAFTGPLLHQVTPDWSVPLTGLIAGTAAFFLNQWTGGAGGNT
ncbi:MAG: AzlC family ABC transporter permease [Rhodospirillaceae bacterium]|nr:AzlC family ABC transporter permease [Rhodospirillaceae bacterium]MBT7512085.1 AzlC family ABC transporter permease [Rhodospirillaceae bacterium]